MPKAMLPADMNYLAPEFYFTSFSQSFQLMSQSLILDNLLNKTSALFSA